MLSTLSSLKLHCQSIHNGLFQLTCPVCGKGLWRESDLKGHMANKHDMQKEFKCDICSKEFGYKSSLKDHLTRIHGSCSTIDKNSVKLDWNFKWNAIPSHMTLLWTSIWDLLVFSEFYVLSVECALDIIIYHLNLVFILLFIYLFFCLISINLKMAAKCMDIWFL